MASSVLVVEDDSDLRSVLRRALREADFEVTTAHDGTEALRAARALEPDLLVVDIGLPDADGRDVCQALRSEGMTAPVLFLTARDAVTDRISGFAAGGDDYLTKPFHVDELIARIGALLRRSGSDPATTIGDLRLDPITHGAESGEERVPLTPTEFRLLAALAAKPGTVVRRAELVRVGWPAGAIVHQNTLDQYLARLRRKLRELGTTVAIETTHGVGYTLR